MDCFLCELWLAIAASTALHLGGAALDYFLLLQLFSDSLVSRFGIKRLNVSETAVEHNPFAVIYESISI